MKNFKLVLINLMIIFGFLCVVCWAEGSEAAPGQEVAIPICGQINSSDTKPLDITVATNITSASFVLSWGNVTSDLQMVLESPGGTLINSSAQQPITYTKNMSLLYYVIPYPEPGNWTAKITAASAPEAGEGYCLIPVLSTDEETGAGIVSNPGDEAPASGECELCNQSG